MQGDEIFAGDEHLHLLQQLACPAVRLIARAVEDEEHVVLVVVELRALAEVQRVLERERVKAEQLAQAARCPPLVGAVRSSQKN